MADVSEDALMAKAFRALVKSGLLFDEIGGEDVHNLASVIASEAGREEPSDSDYCAAYVAVIWRHIMDKPQEVSRG